MAAMPIGTLIQKIDRQPIPLTSTPPSSGPRARLSPKTDPQMPTALARSFRSVKVLTMIDMATGLSIEPPTACRPRNATSQPSPGATLHSREPRENVASPAWNTRRRPRRSAREPESISRQAIASTSCRRPGLRSLTPASAARPSR
jgi:hypothetical protein